MAATTEEQINVLVELQGLDAQIYRLREEMESKPRRLETMQNACRGREAAIEEMRKKIKSIDVLRKEKEIELQTKEASVKKYQAQLYQIKTNKEYTSLLSEIEGLKADSSVLEEDILKLFEETDRIRDEIKKEEGQLAQDKDVLRNEEEKVKQELEVIGARLKELNQARGVLTPRVILPLLDRYERILKNRNGLAVVSAENDSCQGCHMELPPQVINEMRLKKEIIYCENCARIVYINPENPVVN
jgi:predicted  nucleic acid-binding Zn-ribbon protein